ncbi:Pr6Pr family membrane protein [Paractinoplanes durhamensis]|uniref:Pr6Pr family membrane protein n=1 Tax=Paractinoplanes durhamensis TaxID=113563 RepID=A0ABQ3YSN5_9ACTN|nr:Pr6Pr family membrane protein [Actinoplanes durhamensis]GIE00608.1 hypothetical protein Adu01nite_19580 [Actinoplanes durhamensis]
MRVYATPQFWWRAVIVACGVAGLLMGEHRIIYYTTQSNVITLGFFAGALYWMVKRQTTVTPAPRLRGAVTLWILITCLISHFMLNHGKSPLPGLTAADPAVALTNRSLFLIHYVVPVMVLLDWVAFGPHRVVRWRSIPLWILYPLGYGLAIEIRAIVLPGAPIRYPYFFLDPGTRGYDWVAGQFVELAVIFVVLGAAVVGLDRLASLGRARPGPGGGEVTPGGEVSSSAPAGPAEAAPDSQPGDQETVAKAAAEQRSA